MKRQLKHGYIINDAGNVEKDGVEVPWQVIYGAIEWRKDTDLAARPDLKTCEICNEFIRLDDYDRHLKAHGVKNG